MIQRTRPACKRTGDHHAQIHLPPLTAQEALLLCNLLDRAITALWRTHGHAMAELLACIDPDAVVSSEPADPSIVTTPKPPHDDPF